MSAWCLAVAASLWLAGPRAVSPPKPALDVLRRPGESTVFSFITSAGKAVSLCEGPRGAYLVYRFSTAAQVELQYPAVLDSSSWRKFTYRGEFRGGGVANDGFEENRLTFYNGGVAYELYESAYAGRGKAGSYEIGIDVSGGQGKKATLIGRAATVRGSLRLTEEQRERVQLD